MYIILFSFTIFLFILLIIFSLEVEQIPIKQEYKLEY